jgi:hypothetical protein
MLKHRATLCTIALLLTLAACAGVHPVTVGGLPADEFIAVVHNRLYNLETGLVIAGETLVSARKAGTIDDATWMRVKETSTVVDGALTGARQAMISYAAGATDADGLTKAIVDLEASSQALMAIVREVS